MPTYITRALATSALTAFSCAAYGQDQDRDRSNMVRELIEEITITATKKKDAEDVQAVPLSVTAFNANSLDVLNVSDLQDLSFSAPNTGLDTVGTFRGFANFSIRGLSVASSVPTIDPTVGITVDGIPLGLNQGVVFDTFDLNSVEVLRGPQGVLFGRNTTGGQVVVNTGNPTEEFSAHLQGNFEVPVGNSLGDPLYQLQAVLSGPIIEDKLLFKVGAFFVDDAGLFFNQVTGENQNAVETVVVRGALEYRWNERATSIVKVEYQDSVGDGPAAQNPGLFERGTFGIGFDNPGSQDSEVLSVSFRTDLDVDFGNGTVTNIFGYRTVDQFAETDIDTTPDPLFDFDVVTDQRQFSNELRYAGTFGDFDITVGSLVFQQELDYDETRTFGGGPVSQSGGGLQDHLILGAFANFGYNITEKLIISAGLRYTFERKEGAVAVIGPDGVVDGVACSVIGGTCILNPFDFDDPDAFEPEFNSVTPRAGIQYFFNDDTQIYANYTRGFRSGVINVRTTDPSGIQFSIDTTGSGFTDDETIDAFELGFKFQTPDNRFTFNAAGFYNRVDGLIRDITAVDPSSPAGVVAFSTNAGDAEFYGGEFEASFAVFDNLLLTGNLGLLDARYLELFGDLTGDVDPVTGEPVIDEADFALELVRAPDFTFGFGMVHDLDLRDGGNIVTTINFSRRGEAALTDNNLGFSIAQNRFNFDVTWHTPLEGLAVSIFGTNLLNNAAFGGETPLPFGQGPFSDGDDVPFTDPAVGSHAPLANPRTLGFEIKYDF